MSNFRMAPYECNPITGACEGGFGGGGPSGYSWAVNNVPLFAGYTGPKAPVLAGPETPILVYDPNAGPNAEPPQTVLGVPVVPGGGQVVTTQTPQAEIAGIPLLWIGAGLLAVFLLSK